MSLQSCLNLYIAAFRCLIYSNPRIANMQKRFVELQTKMCPPPSSESANPDQHFNQPCNKSSRKLAICRLQHPDVVPQISSSDTRAWLLISPSDCPFSCNSNKRFMASLIFTDCIGIDYGTVRPGYVLCKLYLKSKSIWVPTLHV